MIADKKLLLEQIMKADDLGIRLEMVGGIPMWEASPMYRHQKAVDRIRATIEPSSKTDDGCDCIHAADVYVFFPDGSFKRPDISIFCQEPEDQDEAIRMVPEAVIEVVSRGYEAKDLEIGPYFYLSQGVKDVVVLNPHTFQVVHFTKKGSKRYESPVTLELTCGCRCTI